MSKFNVRKIGVTGHQSLSERLADQGAHHTEEQAWRWIEDTFAAILAETPPSETVVVSCLASGADQRLARMAVAQGIRLEVIIASEGYEETFTEAKDRREFESLLAAADEVIRIDRAEPSEEAFYMAGKCAVNLSHTMVAVWDGQPAAGLGGTGDVVEYAHQRGRAVLQLDPIHRSVHRLAPKE